MGLYDSGNNKIGVNTAVQSGLKFNDDGQLQVNPGRAMVITPDGKLEPDVGQFNESKPYPSGLYITSGGHVGIKIGNKELGKHLGGLTFDDEGYLTFNPKKLSIQDGTNVIEYNAKDDDIVITLGPGLKISE
jgi:hypothetical protein